MYRPTFKKTRWDPVFILGTPFFQTSGVLRPCFLCPSVNTDEHCYMIFHDFGVVIASANVVGGAS